MSINVVFVAALAVVLAVLPADARAQAEGTEGQGDPVVALVNGAKIHRSELARAHQGLPQQYQSEPLEAVYSQLLERLISNKLMALEGRKAKLQDDEEVTSRMALFEEQLVAQFFVQRHAAELMTEDALKERYKKFLDENPPQEELHLRHILLETEEEAKAAILEIQGGADFAEIAKTKSTGPSAENGGDLGYFGREGLVPEFSEAAFSLEPGEITRDPVQTKFGWHVIKVEEKRVVEPPSFEATRGQLVSEMFQVIVSDLLAELRDGATIERFNLDGSKPTE